jgi:ADP-heptose:LPS heptosyltransferase
MTLTAAVESLHAAYPGKYLTDVRTSCPAIWEHNPHITSLQDEKPGTLAIDMHYPQINRSNQTPVNFLSCYTEYLGDRLNVPLRLATNRPHLYLSDEEKSWMTMPQQHFTHGRRTRYWIVVAGTKRDYTCKQWPVEHYQEVVDRTRGKIQWVQIGEAGHQHPPLCGVIDVRGQTDHRQLIRLAYHADGGIGPVTYLLHLMAAFQKPYIYIAGGREPPTWISYQNVHCLHTVGQLPCCQTQACWKSRVVPLGDGDHKDRELCEHPIVGLERPAPKCMAMIRPSEVASILERFCV